MTHRISIRFVAPLAVAAAAACQGAYGPDNACLQIVLAQCRFGWEKVRKLLKEHGATVSDIVKATTYVTDMRYRDEMRKCRTEVFAGKPLPPHTLLQVVALARPGMMFEVDVVAAVAVGK